MTPHEYHAELTWAARYLDDGTPATPPICGALNRLAQDGDGFSHHDKFHPYHGAPDREKINIPDALRKAARIAHQRGEKGDAERRDRMTDAAAALDDIATFTR